MNRKKEGIQRFLLEDGQVRGEIAYLDVTYQQILNQRPYPEMVRKLLGESMMSCLLIAHTLKFEGSLSLQFESDDRLSLILVQCDHLLNIRALAKFQPELSTEAYTDAFLKGQMVFTVQSNSHTQGYQSKLPIESSCIAENLMKYFSQSAQIPTFVWIATSEHQASGMLLQRLPNPDQKHTTELERESFWEYALNIGQTLTPEELLSLDNETLLYRLYHETTVRLFEHQSARFQCRCTPERMKYVLRVMGEEECHQILSTHKTIDVCCEFCNQNYQYDAVDIGLVFKSS